MPWRNIPVEVPPGFHRGGSALASRGRWYDGDLVRWRDGVMQPFGGEVQGVRIRGMNTTPIDAHAWVSRDGTPLLAVGSTTRLRVWNESTGDVAAVSNLAATDSTTETDYRQAETWSLDNWGGDLVARAPGTGRIVRVDTSAENLRAELVGQTPEGALFPVSPETLGVVTTPERFLMAFGVKDAPNRVEWCAQGDLTVWVPEVDNSAGGDYVAISGEFLAGKRARRETLLWTTAELVAVRYIGQPFYYRFDVVGEATCVSRRAMAVQGSRAFWMGRNNFWMYTGQVERLPCDVGDLVFGHLNRDAERVVWCERRDQFGEVIWHYPSGVSETCDRYVAFNYELGVWYFGTSNMQIGVDAGVLSSPISLAANARMWTMESGVAFQGDRSPWAETGIIDITEGRNLMRVDTIYPDASTTGDLKYRIYVGDSPRGTFSALPQVTKDDTLVPGHWDAAERVDVRLEARHLRLRIDQDEGGWRYGLPRLRVQEAGWR